VLKILWKDSILSAFHEDYPVHVGVGVAVAKGKSFLGFAAK
jgi:hypothetical protein